MPAPVDHVLVQADLSVVVPGPPEPELAAELDVIAEQESASVRRVTAASVRRALDVGYRATDLHALIKKRSRTPVPQALTYLILVRFVLAVPITIAGLGLIAVRYGGLRSLRRAR